MSIILLMSSAATAERNYSCIIAKKFLILKNFNLEYPSAYESCDFPECFVFFSSCAYASLPSRFVILLICSLLFIYSWKKNCML